jgi:predicted O-methyltransferase YrrM
VTRRPPSPPDAPATFEDTLAAIRDVEGWLSDDQARVLWERARSVPPGGQIVEIGSYRGRSAIVMAHAAAGGASVIAIDPHAGDDRGPQQIRGTAEQGAADNAAFRANLERAGVEDAVRHVRRPSGAALGDVEGPIDLLYVDGAHRFGPAREDIVRWGARVRPGGTLLIHDAFSSIGVTLALAATVFAGRDYAYARRSRSLAEYRRVAAPLRAAERLRNAARQAAQLPWFARNVLVKVALVLRLRPLARLLGHRSGDWPY